MRKILEICCGDIAAVAAAKLGGATRIELCCGLAEGGLTPSKALIEMAVESGIQEINVLIRPRPGDFLYTHDETEMMERDIITTIETGATGIVIGALTAEGDIDMSTCRRLVDAGISAAAHSGRKKPNITFHRAIDVCRNPIAALEDVISLGCDCLLTSGFKGDAESGISNIRQLMEKADGRITIVAGAGINPGNAAKILSESGADGIHSTARQMVKSNMLFRSADVSFDEDRLITDPKTVAALVKVVNDFII